MDLSLKKAVIYIVVSLLVWFLPNYFIMRILSNNVVSDIGSWFVRVNVIKVTLSYIPLILYYVFIKETFRNNTLIKMDLVLKVFLSSVGFITSLLYLLIRGNEVFDIVVIVGSFSSFLSLLCLIGLIVVYVMIVINKEYHNHIRMAFGYFIFALIIGQGIGVGFTSLMLFSGTPGYRIVSTISSVLDIVSILVVGLVIYRFNVDLVKKDVGQAKEEELGFYSDNY